ncbi:glycoside hydrolase superfamily [Radiomyces spectabilis]|uniref:glycoside hydrolase superfamily n=1 Tax=Radiomyces spectabilis TaxID=64574 RepID=UPI00221FDB48|nr:glycoside hydrolase superfamily [Radiomyces spectabilis]KAI8390948.1 glycoside hydrolase superfamily [Radiomyces spectabilis]
MCGFHGTTPSQGIIDLIQHHNLGSVILFSRNIESPEQTKELTRSLQEVARLAGHRRPLFIAVDQENGVVRRLGQHATYLPGNMALGALNSSSAARDVAQATAEEMLALGINWNLAPVLDVNNNPLNPVIGVRSYGEDPDLVARLGIAQIEGYQINGVATSVKHFPGHGDTATDSHLGVPVIEKTLDDLEKVELIPFRKAFAGDKNSYPTSVMVAHVSLPHLIHTKGHVASLSSEIVNDLLRKELGYNGVVITDCLEMDAVKDTVGTAQGALVALQAGNDIAMVSHTYDSQRDAVNRLKTAITNEQVDKEALQASLKRVAELKDRFLSWDSVFKDDDLSQIGSDKHLKLSKQLYDRVPTLVRDRKQLLPLRPKESDKILFLAAHVPLTLAIDCDPRPFNPFHDSLVRRHKNVEYIIFDEATSNLTEKIQSADYVIVGTANGNLHPYQVNMVKLAHEHAKKLITVAVINPYDLMTFTEIDTHIVTYEYSPPAHEAAVRLIMGENTSSSRLPVTIPGVGCGKNEERQCGYHVSDYHDSDLKDVFKIWQDNFQDTWPLSFDKFELVLRTSQEPRHFVVRASKVKGEVIGFVSTQMVDSVGQVALLMVAPQYQKQGVGSLLHDHAVAYLRNAGAKSLKLGSTYPRFFCGVPDDDAQGKAAQDVFEHRGWKFQGGPVWDLKGDLTNYETPQFVVERMKNENVWFGPIKAREIDDLFAFQEQYFPYWLSTYKRHVEVGDLQDLIVAREGGENGPIIGSLVLYTTNQSNENRADLIWTDESLFGQQSGGMACVGVATEQRGRGIGLGIVAHGNQVLKSRGVKTSYVDWVELVTFYGRLSYQKWRSYRLGFM